MSRSLWITHPRLRQSPFLLQGKLDRKKKPIGTSRYSEESFFVYLTSKEAFHKDQRGPWESLTGLRAEIHIHDMGELCTG